MKSIITQFFLVILILYSYNILAQNSNLTKSENPEDKVSILNSNNDVLLDINDETDGGSITIPPLTTIGDGTGKLYNIANQLYWNNLPISQLLGSNGWSLNNQIVALSDLNFSIGIGTQNPLEKIHIENGRLLIRGIDNWFPGITVHNAVGRSVFHLRGTTNSNNFSSSEIVLEDLTNSKRWSILNTNSNTFTLVNYSEATSYRSPFKIDFAAPTNSFAMNMEGNIGIGTAPTLYKLAVAGSIISEEVIVKLQSNWPDYVFGENYILDDIEDVKHFIKNNGHLKGIPSAEEIAQSGVNLAEVQKKLLQKIEELTLYIIKQNEDLIKLKNEIAVLSSNVEKSR